MLPIYNEVCVECWDCRSVLPSLLSMHRKRNKPSIILIEIPDSLETAITLWDSFGQQCFVSVSKSYAIISTISIV